MYNIVRVKGENMNMTKGLKEFAKKWAMEHKQEINDDNYQVEWNNMIEDYKKFHAQEIKAKKRAYKKQYRKAHKNEIKEYSKKYIQKHKAQLNEYHRKWYNAHKDEINAKLRQQRELAKKYLLEHPNFLQPIDVGDKKEGE